MCGACGTGTVRPPWEVIVAGNRPADRRRRAAAAGQATGGRLKVRPWGAAGYLLSPRTGPMRTFPSLQPLAATLLPHLRLDMPLCGSCHHREVRRLVRLPPETDMQRLVVWSALATANGCAGGLTIEIHAGYENRSEGSQALPISAEHNLIRVLPVDTPHPSVVLSGPHAEQYAANLVNYLDGGPLRATPFA